MILKNKKNNLNRQNRSAKPTCFKNGPNKGLQFLRFDFQLHQNNNRIIYVKVVSLARSVSIRVKVKTYVQLILDIHENGMWTRYSLHLISFWYNSQVRVHVETTNRLTIHGSFLSPDLIFTWNIYMHYNLNAGDQYFMMMSK